MTPAMWKLEGLNRDIRMQASQFAYWAQQGFSIWVVSIVLLVFFGLTNTPERKHNVVVWVRASAWAAVKPTKTVVWQGKPYDARLLAVWMSETIYKGSLWQWLLWAAYVGILPLSIGGSVLLWWARRPEETEKHIRGATILEVCELQRVLTKAGPVGMNVAGVRIPKELEQTHVLICGATGSGKSVTIRQLLRQFAENNEACVVVDPDGEFVREFYDPARGDWLLNPIDARCPTWSPWAEGDSEAETAAQAASLFPIVPGMAEAAAYYHTAARRTYRELLQHARGKEAKYIPDLLAEAAREKGSRLTTKEVISTMQNALDAFRYLQPGQRDWSAREWVTQPQGWCFLTFREQEKDAVLPILSLWLESLTRRFLSSDIAPKQTVRVVIDELAVLKAQPTLAELMSRGRKRGVSVVLGFQDVNQLYAIYGKNFTSNILNQPATRLFLRTNDGETQEWCAQNIGQREVQRYVEIETGAPADGRDSITRSPQRKEEPAVMGSQFGQLPNLSGYLKVAHYGTAQVEFPYVGLVERQPAFVGRKEDAQASDQKGSESKASEGGQAVRKKVDVSSTRRAL